MKWVTRARPKTDRIACPWLIRKFIDADADILYVPTDQVLTVAEREQAHGFDAPGAEYDHRGNKCTFEVLIDDHRPRRRSVPWPGWRASCTPPTSSSEIDTDPFAPALLALAFGGLDVEADDHRLLERASFVYDALYAWCAQQVAENRVDSGRLGGRTDRDAEIDVESR